jgi:hypothetical protein
VAHQSQFDAIFVDRGLLDLWQMRVQRGKDIRLAFLLESMILTGLVEVDNPELKVTTEAQN